MAFYDGGGCDLDRVFRYVSLRWDQCLCVSVSQYVLTE